jgi:hypothetical protein
MGVGVIALLLLSAYSAGAQTEPALVVAVSRDLVLEPDSSEISLSITTDAEIAIAEILLALTGVQAGPEHLAGLESTTSIRSDRMTGTRVDSRGYWRWVIPSTRSIDADRDAIEALKRNPPRGIAGIDYAIRRIVSRTAVEKARSGVYRELIDSARLEAGALAAKRGFRIGPILAINESLTAGRTVRLQVEFGHADHSGAVPPSRRLLVAMDREVVPILSRTRVELEVTTDPLVSRDRLLAIGAGFGFTEAHLRGVNGLLPRFPRSRRFTFGRDMPGVDHSAIHQVSREIRELPGFPFLFLRTTLEESAVLPERRSAADSLLIEQARQNAEALGAAAGLQPGHLRTLAQLESERFMPANILVSGYPREGLITDRTARKLVVGFAID